MCNSVEDFEILAEHDVKGGAKNRKLNCLRTPMEDIAKCPACAHSNPDISNVKTKIYIKLIHYIPDAATGKLVPKAKVWERSYSYAKKIASLFDDYPNLSDYIVSVTRIGKQGDTKTDYQINVLSNNPVYNNDNCPKLDSAFNGYKALGRIVLNKNYSDMTTFFQTGAFPVKENTQQNGSTAAPAPAYNPNEITPRTTASTASTQDYAPSFNSSNTDELPF